MATYLDDVREGGQIIERNLARAAQLLDHRQRREVVVLDALGFGDSPRPLSGPYTLEDHAVTIRHRDSMEQERVALDQVESYLAARLIGA